MHIKNEIHISLSRGEPTTLVLLGLSAAFDTVDNDTLLNWLKSWFGVCSMVLKWSTSYLSHCFQAIKLGSTLGQNWARVRLGYDKALFSALYSSLYTPLL